MGAIGKYKSWELLAQEYPRAPALVSCWNTWRGVPGVAWFLPGIHRQEAKCLLKMVE